MVGGTIPAGVVVNVVDVNCVNSSCKLMTFYCQRVIKKNKEFICSFVDIMNSLDETHREFFIFPI
jgi:hypothetical protein